MNKKVNHCGWVRRMSHVLNLFHGGVDRQSAEGDFIEAFEELRIDRGKLRAGFWILIQFWMSILRIGWSRLQWNARLTVNSYKSSIRKMTREKTTAWINLFGLSFGMACCILIGLWIQDECMFDRFHENSRIFRINCIDRIQGMDSKNDYTSPPLGPFLMDAFTEVNAFVRFGARNHITIQFEDHSIQGRCGFTDPSLFSVFTFPLLQGIPEDALAVPDGVVITESMARILFGDMDPMNRIVSLDKRISLRITGVMKDVPRRSSLQFDFLTRFEHFNVFLGALHFIDHWGLRGFQTFLQLQETAIPGEFEEKIKGVQQGHDPRHETKLELQPFSRIYLYGVNGGPIRLVLAFSVIALFILFIAAFNYINLTMARSVNRIKEMNIRKTLGAQRSQLISQFLCESISMSAFAFLGSSTIVLCLLPLFSQWSGKSFTADAILSPLMGVFAIIAILLGLLSGIYPAISLSKHRPMERNGIHRFDRKATLRRLFMTLQFAVSVILIIGTMIVFKQLRTMRSMHPGFNPAGLIFIDLNDELAGAFDSIKGELLRNSDIIDVTKTSTRIGIETNLSGIQADWEGRTDPQIGFHVISGDADLIRTMGMTLKEGRSFNPEISTDESNVILNEEAVRRMGIQDPVGKRFNLFGGSGTIIGVVSDFHLQSMHHTIEPTLIAMVDGIDRYLVIRVREGKSAPLTYIQRICTDRAPSFPFEYRFLSDEFDKTYLAEKRLAQLLSAFTSIALVTSCLGLFGLALFAVEQRTREIGIRKTLGASSANIMILICSEFLRLVLYAAVLAWPVTWIVMRRWLQEYAYKAEIRWEFLLASLLVMFIALMTLIFQVLRASMANPVKCLKYE